MNIDFISDLNLSSIDVLLLAFAALPCLLTAYGVAIFPMLLSCLGKFARRPWVCRDIRPRVTVIIPAHNEQAVIARKLENILASEYPADALEIVVASDCSTDRTDEIVRSFAPRVRLVRAETRSGK